MGGCNPDVNRGRAIGIVTGVFMATMALLFPVNVAATAAMLAVAAAVIAIASLTCSEPAVWISATASVLIYIAGVFIAYGSYRLDAVAAYLLSYVIYGAVMALLNRLMP